jgi:hypothetical protein
MEIGDEKTFFSPLMQGEEKGVFDSRKSTWCTWARA